MSATAGGMGDPEVLGAVSVRVKPGTELLDLLARLRERGAEILTVNTFPATRGEPNVERVIDIEVRAFSSADAAALLADAPGVEVAEPKLRLWQIFGKGVMVIGGGAQVTQVLLGAVSEADRHNLRGQRISVETIPLVGEADLAAAVRAVADLPRVQMLVLAGSIMGGDITTAVHELRETGMPVIALNMAGSVPDAADLVVSDPVQAGTMAVMAVADTAAFSIERQRGRRY